MYIVFVNKLLDVATEKSQQNLIHGIEGFDASKLKHAQTQEKNPLPDKDGEYTPFFFPLTINTFRVNQSTNLYVFLYFFFVVHQ